MVDEAKALSGSISRRASEVRAYVADLDVPGRIRENPLAFAGAAIALGYPGDPASLPAPLRDRELGPRNRKPLRDFVMTGEWNHPAPFVS